MDVGSAIFKLATSLAKDNDAAADFCATGKARAIGAGVQTVQSEYKIEPRVKYPFAGKFLVNC